MWGVRNGLIVKPELIARATIALLLDSCQTKAEYAAEVFEAALTSNQPGLGTRNDRLQHQTASLQQMHGFSDEEIRMALKQLRDNGVM